MSDTTITFTVRGSTVADLQSLATDQLMALIAPTSAMPSDVVLERWTVDYDIREGDVVNMGSGERIVSFWEAYVTAKRKV